MLWNAPGHSSLWCTGTLWDYLGRSGKILDPLGHSGPPSGHSRTLWEALGSSGMLLNTLGQCTLGCSGKFQDSPGHSGGRMGNSKLLFGGKASCSTTPRPADNQHKSWTTGSTCFVVYFCSRPRRTTRNMLIVCQVTQLLYCTYTARRMLNHVHFFLGNTRNTHIFLETAFECNSQWISIISGSFTFSPRAFTKTEIMFQL